MRPLAAEDELLQCLPATLRDVGHQLLIFGAPGGNGSRRVGGTDGHREDLALVLRSPSGAGANAGLHYGSRA